MFIRLVTASVATLLCDAAVTAGSSQGKRDAPAYRITVDVHRPHEAEVQLRAGAPITRISSARGGDVSSVRNVRCFSGQAVTWTGSTWQVPLNCSDVRWTVKLLDLDNIGVDASSLRSTFSLKDRFWMLVERDALLRASDADGRVTIHLTAKGRTLAMKSLALPAIGKPPFIGAIFERGTTPVQRHGMEVTYVGPAPQFGWLPAVDDQVLATWSRWRRDLGYRDAPRRLDWIWLRTSEDADPGCTTSAGAEAILAQLKVRPDDPDFEAKARVVYATTAMHEGFHVMSGSHAHGWPAWVNESLASHFAIEASRRLIDESDRMWLERFFLSPRTGTPLMTAQQRYAAGAVDQGATFYSDGPAFWREIETVLDIAPNASGRLAALLAKSHGFRGIDLTDGDALAHFLDRYSSGKARPIVERYLQGAVHQPYPESRHHSVTSLLRTYYPRSAPAANHADGERCGRV